VGTVALDFYEDRDNLAKRSLGLWLDRGALC
jgi:hypothetical protein